MAIEWLEVVDRIESGENARTEFKRGFDRSAISRTLCAFANGDGGLLVLGVDDSQNIVGVDENTEKVQEKLTNILQNSCGRPISAECDRYKTDEKWIHWVDVRSHQRSGQPFSYDGRFWIHRGRSSVAPSPSELQELLNTFGLVLTEQQVILSATVSDIDLGAFRTFMRKQGKAVEEDSFLDIETDLKNASVCNIQDNVLTPTLYGLMVFGRDPQSHPYTTSLFVQFVAYDGTDRAADVLSVGEGKGCLEDQVMRSIGWFRSLGRTENYRGLHRVDSPLIPEEALREAVVNAVIHRDYALTGTQVLLEVFSDRIDVTSPGTLPNHMTVEHARSGGAPRSRNEMMANAMVVTGLMERRGRGWLLMRKAMREFNGMEPALVNDESGRFVRVTFHLDSDTSG